MDNKHIEFQHRFLQNNYNKEDYELSSLIICTKIINFIKEKNIKSVLLVHNSLYEPQLKELINYWLKRNIDLYFSFYDRKSYLKYFKVEQDNYELYLYRYTLMPIPKYKKVVHKEVNVDLLLVPAMAYNLKNKIIDYSEGLIKLILIRNKDIKNICSYAFSFQEADFQDSEEFRVDKIFNEIE